MAKKSKDVEVNVPSFDSNIIGALASDLNKEFKTSLGKIAYVGNEDSPSDISDWVSTGCDMLDLAISNRPNGGLPVGRIVELQGWSASGKSLLAAHICAETQKKNGIAVYIDTENAVSTDFFTAIGVDISKNWLYVPMSELENIFLTIEKIISKIRSQNTGQIVTIVVDSIMGATTKVEATSDYEKDGWATSKAIVLSKAMRKITGLIANEKILLVLTNQLRSKLGVSFGDNSCVDPFTTKVKIRYTLD